MDTLNNFLAETEKMAELELDAQTVNYKDRLIESYRTVEDPFGREIEDINYEMNPSDPTSLI